MSNTVVAVTDAAASPTSELLDTVRFDPPDADTWEAAASAGLRGKPSSSLNTTTIDGIVRQPLYTATDGQIVTSPPGFGDHRRGATAASTLMAWDIRQAHDASHPEANARILADLEGGATSILLVNAPNDVDALDAVLDGVLLDLAGVHLDDRNAADALVQLWERRDVGATAIGSLGLDPIGALATTGGSGATPDTMLDPLAMAANAVSVAPHVTVARADGRPFAESGSGDVTEVAAALSNAVAYVRALTDHGLTIDDAISRVSVLLTVGPDQFLSIAKLRAARVCWARIAEASGAETRGLAIHAVTASWMMTERDPWVNMLRTTTATFAAAVGGASAVTVLPFDDAIGRPSDLGLRIARNTHMLLGEESGIGHVVDPAGGSFYVESLTDQLAGAIWSTFQQLEAEGGVAAALRSGSLQATIAANRAAAETAAADRSAPITGVTEFPDLAEIRLDRSDRPDRATLVDAMRDIDPLPRSRAAQPFEELRDAADAQPQRPTVFGANLGQVAVHTARAAFASNLFAAGGVAISSNDGFTDSQSCADAFAASGLSTAVICSSDAMYGDIGVEVAGALKAAGARHVWLAGSPRDHLDALRAAGVDDFVTLGGPALETLRRAHDVMEVAR